MPWRARRGQIHHYGSSDSAPGGNQFDAIAKRVLGKGATYLRHGGVVFGLKTCTAQIGKQIVETFHPQRGMRLFRRAKLRFNAQMQLQRAALKPRATTTGEFRRFLQFGEA